MAQLQEALAQVKTRLDLVEEALQPRCQHVTIVAFSGDMDRLYAALAIATGAAAMGMKVSVFFTFWGLNAIRKRRVLKGKGLCQALISLLLPSGPHHLPTSRFNMLGIGPRFFGYLMRKGRLSNVPGLIETARQAGVRLVACQNTVELMGIRPDELIEGIEFGGVATYLMDAARSKVSLFI
jgi:peroxiredoxin family protein